MSIVPARRVAAALALFLAPALSAQAAQLAVIGEGDPALVIPVVQALEEQAAAAGWTLTESPDAADRVLRVEVDVVGRSELQSHRRFDTQTVAQLRVRALDGDGRPLGAGLRQGVRYTAQTADAEAARALDGRTGELIGVPGAR